MEMKKNRELRALALKELKGNWSDPVLAGFVYLLLACVSSFLTNFGNIYDRITGDQHQIVFFTASIGFFYTLFFLVPLAYGMYIVFLKFYRGDKVDCLSKLFDTFKVYGRALGIGLLVSIYTLLWSLLLIVPGIIKSYAYGMSYFILHDHPEMSVDEAIDASIVMMKGYKMKLFLLDLSFIGWCFLSVLSAGIGFLWVFPYYSVARVAFYENLKELRNSEISGEAAPIAE